VSRSEDQARQALLAAEHATIYAYGVLGARLPEPLRPAALAAYDAHRAHRDALTTALRAAGAEAPAAQGAYDVTVVDAAAATALAVQVEEGLALRWRDLVGATVDPGVRSEGVAGLTGSAVRAAQWRSAQGVRPASVPFPGA
jgi:hypothetical protein